MSNELGAGNPDRGKHAVAVTLKITACLALAVVILLALCHNIWAGFFSDSTVIIKNYAYMTPLLVVSILLDNAQAVLSGANNPDPLALISICISILLICDQLVFPQEWQEDVAGSIQPCTST